MKEFVISEAKAETAVLVGLITKEQDEAKTKEYLDELEFLADTAGAVTVKRFTQKVGGPSQTTYVGSGKLQEIKAYIKQREDAPRPQRPRRRWNWRSTAICCPDCNVCGHTWSARVVDPALVAVKALSVCVDRVRRSWRWTGVSSCSVSPC